MDYNSAMTVPQFGTISGDQYAQLLKALVAQEGVTDIANLVGGGALQPQSLEQTVAQLTWDSSHLKFWKDIPTSKAFSTLEEYTLQDAYGMTGGPVGQMINPEEGDPEYRRAYAQVKFFRTMWKFSDVLGHTRTITPAEVESVQGAINRLLRIAETQLFFGDATLLPETWNGLEKTIVDAGSVQVIDLRGAIPTTENFKNGAQIIHDNFGSPTKCYMSPGVQTAMDSIMEVGTGTDLRRLLQNNVTASGIMLGHRARGVHTSFGDIGFEPDVFLAIEAQEVPKKKNPAAPAGALIEGPTSEKAPATPTFALVVNAPAVAGSLWAATGVRKAVNTYSYRVAAVNQYGKSQAAVLVAAGANVLAGGSVSVNITSGGGAFAPAYYEVYSQPVAGSSEMLYMGRVKDTSGTATYADLNLELPGTSKAFIVDLTPSGKRRTVTLSQLVPVHRQEYAKIGPYRWGVANLYAVPKWYAPNRFVMLKNVGVGTRHKSKYLDL